jgi:hypothetical protein
MLERYKTMAPDEQRQFVAKLKEHGIDTSAFPAPPASAPKAAKPGNKSTAQSADTIDQLFAPLPPVESRGRAWLYMDKQLKPVQLRLGITDGTNTELLSGELQPGMELVTGVILSGSSARPTAASANGNPLMPGGRGPGRGR